MKPHVLIPLLCLATASLAQTRPTPAPATQPKKPTLAVLPFTAADAKDKPLAERMRFAVSQKLSTDQNAATAAGPYDRLDNVAVDNTLSALQLSATEPLDPADLQQLLSTLGTDFTIAGAVKGRTLSLTLYQGATPAKTAAVDIPPASESPKLAVEKILTDLTGTAFARIRDVEADHSDPAAETRFARNPNLVPDPGFDAAAASPRRLAAQWQAILGPDHYPPPLLSAAAGQSLPPDRVAVVPAADAAGNPAGYYLQMRMSQTVAENNGLACESTWIPVEQGKKYRFTARYRSTGPVARIFLKGFALKPDGFGDKNDPEAARREFYRAQVLPRPAAADWSLIEMDFTPSTLNPTDPPIQWLKVDLYIYLHAGDAFFDDVTVKKISD
jgi:hypothetical protein